MCTYIMKDADSVREAIVESASWLFDRFGYEKTSVDEIARRAHRAKTSVYYYFDGKLAIFKAVDGSGLSRVDFFVARDTGEVVFNEINTLPGFTAISMYPMLWEHRGISKPQLVEKLIQMAFSRKER